MRFCRNCYKNKVNYYRTSYEYCQECQQKNATLTEEELKPYYKKLHESQKYGVSADYCFHFTGPIVAKFAPKSVLDFGCGQSKFLDLLDFPELERRERYDFAIPEYSVLPEGEFDLVTCFDVMEHIPEGNIDNILTRIKSKSPNVLFKISCVMAGCLLDGNMNAHCTLKTVEEWIEVLKKYFPKVEIIPYGDLKVEFICKTW